MNQRLFFLLVSVVGVGQPALAQTDTSQAGRERAAFAMTKATVEFLATDARTFGYDKTPCQPCDTYNDLRRFIKQNHLAKADEIVADVRRMAPGTPPADLRQFLLKRVTQGADRAHRTTLASFADYQRALDAAVSSLSMTGETPTVAQQSDEPADADVFDEEPIVGDSTQTDASVGATFPNETTSSQSSLNDQSSMLSYLTLVLSLLSLAGVVVLFLRQNQNRPASTVDVNKDVLNEMNQRISKLERTNTDLFNQVALLEKTANQLRNNSVSQSQSRPVQPAPIPPSVPAQPTVAPRAESVVPSVAPAVAPTAPANTPRPPQPEVPTLLYGRTADLGDGFSVSGLSTKPDRDTVFEIARLDAGRAEFRVSDNPDMQRLALSDPYSYLNDTCTYATQPRPGSYIRTERPGSLSLQGEKWVITEKAQISFTG